MQPPQVADLRYCRIFLHHTKYHKVKNALFPKNSYSMFHVKQREPQPKLKKCTQSFYSGFLVASHVTPLPAVWQGAVTPFKRAVFCLNFKNCGKSTLRELDLSHCATSMNGLMNFVLHRGKKLLCQLHILEQREHPFWTNVNSDSDGT